MPRFTPDNGFTKGYTRLFNCFRKLVNEFEGFSKISEALSKWNLLDQMNALFFSPCKPMRSGFCVLNHGDCWVNNFMFKVDESGNSTNVKMIDFQLSYWVSAKIQKKTPKSRPKHFHCILLFTVTASGKNWKCPSLGQNSKKSPKFFEHFSGKSCWRFILLHDLFRSR